MSTPTNPSMAVIQVSATTNQDGKWYVNRYTITGIKIIEIAMMPVVIRHLDTTKLLINPAANAASPWLIATTI